MDALHQDSMQEQKTEIVCFLDSDSEASTSPNNNHLPHETRVLSTNQDQILLEDLCNLHHVNGSFGTPRPIPTTYHPTERETSLAEALPVKEQNTNHADGDTTKFSPVIGISLLRAPPTLPNGLDPTTNTFWGPASSHREISREMLLMSSFCPVGRPRREMSTRDSPVSVAYHHPPEPEAANLFIPSLS